MILMWLCSIVVLFVVKRSLCYTDSPCCHAIDPPEKCSDENVLNRTCLISSMPSTLEVCCSEVWYSFCVEYIRLHHSICEPVCGNGICEPLFDCSTCPYDCGKCDENLSCKDSESSTDEPLHHLQWYLFGNIDLIHSSNISGEGVSIGIVDCGIQSIHYELQCGMNNKLSRDFTKSSQSFESGNETVSQSSLILDNHATSIAGLIAARRNDLGILGISYGSSIIDLRVRNSLEDVSVYKNDYDLAKVLSYEPNEIDILLLSFLNSDSCECDEIFYNDYSISLGAFHDLSVLDKRIFIIPSGRHQNVPSGNFLTLRNSPYAIVISDGSLSSTNNALSFNLEKVRSSGEKIISIDRLGFGGFNSSSDFIDNLLDFETGSNIASTILTGYISLLKSYSSDLDTRSLLWLFALTCQTTSDQGWAENSGGVWYHSKYGFGDLNMTYTISFLEKYGDNNIKSSTRRDSFLDFKNYGKKEKLFQKISQLWPVCEKTDEFRVFFDHLGVYGQGNYGEEYFARFVVPFNSSLIVEHVQVCFYDFEFSKNQFVMNSSLSIESPSQKKKSIVFEPNEEFNEAYRLDPKFQNDDVIEKDILCFTTLQFWGEKSVLIHPPKQEQGGRRKGRTSPPNSQAQNGRTFGQGKDPSLRREGPIEVGEDYEEEDRLDWNIRYSFPGLIRLESVELRILGFYEGCNYPVIYTPPIIDEEHPKRNLLVSVSKIVIMGFYGLIVFFLTTFFGIVVIRITFCERVKVFSLDKISEEEENKAAENIFLELMDFEMRNPDDSSASNFTDDSLDSTDVSDISLYED